MGEPTPQLLWRYLTQDLEPRGAVILVLAALTLLGGIVLADLALILIGGVILVVVLGMAFVSGVLRDAGRERGARREKP